MMFLISVCRCCFAFSQEYMAEYTTQLGGSGSLWQGMGRNWVHKFTCDLHVSFLPGFRFLVFVGTLLVHDNSKFWYKADFVSFQNVVNHWFDRLAFWRFRIVIWITDSVRFLCSLCVCYLSLQIQFPTDIPEPPFSYKKLQGSKI